MHSLLLLRFWRKICCICMCPLLLYISFEPSLALFLFPKMHIHNNRVDSLVSLDCSAFLILCVSSATHNFILLFKQCECLRNMFHQKRTSLKKRFDLLALLINVFLYWSLISNRPTWIHLWIVSSRRLFIIHYLMRFIEKEIILLVTMKHSV